MSTLLDCPWKLIKLINSGSWEKKAMQWGNEEKTKAPLIRLQGEQETKFVSGAFLALSTPCAGCSGFQRPPTPKRSKVNSQHITSAPSPKCSGSQIPSLSLSPNQTLTVSMLSVSARYQKKMTYFPLKCVCLVTYTSWCFFKRCTLTLMKLVMEFWSWTGKFTNTAHQRWTFFRIPQPRCFVATTSFSWH